ncbi:MAG: hypothetical protein RBR15_12850 [Sphaerochaeta sp.]|nr:hypothetical protein [Sphaerochaeta sp.]
MSRDGFTEDQLSRLQQNPYVVSASKGRIKFSKSLHVMVIKKIAEGESLSTILLDVGIDAHWLSKDQKKKLRESGIDSGYKYLTEEQQLTLSKNKYISRVSEKSISYTDEFYNELAKEYAQGKNVHDILVSLGIDPAVLGKKRRQGIVICMKRYQARAGNDGELHKLPMGPPKPSNKVEEIRTIEEEIVYLRQQITYLKQENEFKKKRLKRREAQGEIEVIPSEKYVLIQQSTH